MKNNAAVKYSWRFIAISVVALVIAVPWFLILLLPIFITLGSFMSVVSLTNIYARQARNLSRSARQLTLIQVKAPSLSA